MDRQLKLEDVKEALAKDLLAVDCKISLFLSAARSPKKNFLLLPFPIFYQLNNEVKDFDKLVGC
jgi:hypothetical protein